MSTLQTRVDPNRIEVYESATDAGAPRRPRLRRQITSRPNCPPRADERTIALVSVDLVGLGS